jgi:hypothetical protein
MGVIVFAWGNGSVGMGVCSLFPFIFRAIAEVVGNVLKPVGRAFEPSPGTRH